MIVPVFVLLISFKC